MKNGTISHRICNSNYQRCYSSSSVDRYDPLHSVDFKLWPDWSIDYIRVCIKKRII